MSSSADVGAFPGNLLSILERIATLSAEAPATLADGLRELESLVLARDGERVQLRREVAMLESERARLARELAESRSRGADLARLYVATDRLHSTLDRGEVFLALEEIVASLVGCEEMAVLELLEEKSLLVPVLRCGHAARALDVVKVGIGPIGAAARSGQPVLATEEALAAGHPAACLPLKVDGAVTGVLVLFRMLEHKGALGDGDQELLDLLGVHAGTALVATRLRLRCGGPHEQ